MNKFMEVISTEFKFLFFRPISPDFKNDGNYYLALGIITAWLAGIGRYWDNPKAVKGQLKGTEGINFNHLITLKSLRPL